MIKLLVCFILGGAALSAAAAAEPALMTLTGDQRLIQVSGTAGATGNSKSYSLSLAPESPFASFSTNVFGHADWPSGSPSATVAHAESGASQESFLTANSFSCISRVWGSDWVSLEGPYGPANPQASSLFDVSFTLDAQVAFALFLEPGGANYSTWPYDQDRGTACLFSGDEINLLLSPVLEATQYGYRYRYSGTLDPGNYNLQVTHFFSLPADPLGQMADLSYTMSFAVSAVPEPSSFALASLGLAGLIAFNRNRKRMEPPAQTRKSPAAE